MKKLMSILLVALIAIGFAIPASAAGAISADEQRILDELNKGVTVGGQKIAVPASEIAKANNHLKANNVGKTACDSVVQNIVAARTLVEKQKVSASSMQELMSKLPKGVVSELQGYITSAANALGLKVRFTATGVELIDGVTGKEVTSYKPGAAGKSAAGGSIVKSTGANYVSSFVVFASLMIAALGAAVIGRKYAKA